MLLPRLLSGIVAAGIVLAGAILWRLVGERRARWLVAALTAYGSVAFLHAMLTGITIRSLLGGQGLFRLLPFVLQGAFVGAFVVLPLGWIVAVVRAGMPRLREGSPRQTIYQAVALTTCVGLVMTSIPRAGNRAHGARRLSPSERIATLDNSLRAIEDGEREAPRDRWDPNDVVRSVGRDPKQLFEWVRDRTDWIPYRGMLRGPVGVLMDRQGNSLDRALLLATLLEKAGHTVRLARGELTREQAVDALPTLLTRRELAFHAPPAPEAAGAVDLGALIGRYGLDAAGLAEYVKAEDDLIVHARRELHSRVVDQAARLLPAISRSGSALAEWRTRLDAALAALRDHWWVQRQNGDAWEDFDVLDELLTSDRPTRMVAETLSTNSIPADLRHQVIVRVEAEQWTAGGISQRTLLEHVLYPDELIGQPIVLQFWPLNWIADSGITPPSRVEFRREVLEQRAWFSVLLVGRQIAARAGVLDNGNELETPTKGGPFGAIADHFAQAMGVKEAEPILSAVTLAFEVRVPGEAPRLERRSVFDLIGPAARAAARTPALTLDDRARLTRALALMMRTETLPLVCQLAPEFASHVAAQTIVGTRELLQAAVRDALPNGTPGTESLFDRAPASYGSALYALALARFHWSRDAELIFIDRPNVLTSHTYAVADADRIVRRDAMDIVFNDIGVSLSARDAFPIRLAQGVLDTNAESLLQLGPHAAVNAGDAFAASRDWTTVAASRVDAVQALKMPDDARRRLRSDVEHGKTVVAPTHPVGAESRSFVAWWRVDPTTGTTLGIGENGWGVSLVERAFQDIWARIRATPFIVYIQNFNVGFYSSYVWCIGVGIHGGMGDPLGRQQTGAEVWAALGDAERCAPNAFIWGLASAVVPLVIMSARILLATRFPRLAPPPLVPRLPHPGEPGPPLSETPGRPAVDPHAKTDPDLSNTSPDLSDTSPDLGKPNPDLAKTDPDLSKTDPDLKGPPTKPSARGPNDPAEPNPRNPDEIKSPKQARQGNDPADLKRAWEQAYREYAAASDKARNAEQGWYSDRAQADAEGRPRPDMPDNVKQAAQDAEEKARAADDALSRLRSAQRDADAAAARAQKAGTRNGDTLPNGQAPAPQGPPPQSPPPQSPPSNPSSPCPPNCGNTEPGFKTLTGVTGVSNTLAGVGGKP